MYDPIVEEVRRIRDAHAARFNYDLRAICRDLKELEAKSGRTYVNYPPKPAREESRKASPPSAAGDAA
jgi:hypothetical protein